MKSSGNIGASAPSFQTANPLVREDLVAEEQIELQADNEIILNAYSH